MKCRSAGTHTNNRRMTVIGWMPPVLYCDWLGNVSIIRALKSLRMFGRDVRQACHKYIYIDIDIYIETIYLFLSCFLLCAT